MYTVAIHFNYLHNHSVGGMGKNHSSVDKLPSYWYRALPG